MTSGVENGLIVCRTESMKQADRIQAVIDALAQQADTSVETQIRLQDHEERIQALEDRDAS